MAPVSMHPSGADPDRPAAGPRLSLPLVCERLAGRASDARNGRAAEGRAAGRDTPAYACECGSPPSRCQRSPGRPCTSAMFGHQCPNAERGQRRETRGEALEVANTPKFESWQSPEDCTTMPLDGVVARSAAIAAAEPRGNANGEAAVRAWRITTNSGTRPASSASIGATGSGRSAGDGQPGSTAQGFASPLACGRLLCVPRGSPLSGG
jgi:hypothetical protein